MLLSGTPGAVFAQQQPPAALSDNPARAQLQMSLRIERGLFALDMVAYNEARAGEQRSREQVAQVAALMDETMSGDSLNLGALESLRDQMAAAREASRIAGERLDEGLVRLQDRLRRIGFLEGELGGGSVAAPPAAPDVLTGRWRVRLQPQDQIGSFDLRRTGTTVTGSYQMNDGSSGTFQGTFVNGNLRLERVDSVRGSDGIFVGTVAGENIAGTWTANVVVTGGPTRGNWTAVRQGER
jgi:hypothetical protein